MLFTRKGHLTLIQTPDALGAGEMAQWSEAFALLLDDRSSVPNTHTWELTITCSYSSRGSHLPLKTPTETHTHTFN